jgi:hypothetical protein
LGLKFEINARDRALTALVSVDLYRVGGSMLNSSPYQLTTPREWDATFWGFDLGVLTSGSYRVDVLHSGKVIATGNFAVR